MVVALPGLVLLWILWKQGFVVEQARQTTTHDADGLATPQKLTP